MNYKKILLISAVLALPITIIYSTYKPSPTTLSDDVVVVDTTSNVNTVEVISVALDSLITEIDDLQGKILDSLSSISTVKVKDLKKKRK